MNFENLRGIKSTPTEEAAFEMELPKSSDLTPEVETLVEKLGGKIVELAFVVELPDLKGREKITGHKVFSITEFAGD